MIVCGLRLRGYFCVVFDIVSFIVVASLLKSCRCGQELLQTFMRASAQIQGGVEVATAIFLQRDRCLFRLAEPRCVHHELGHERSLRWTPIHELTDFGSLKLGWSLLLLDRACMHE